MTDKMKLWDSVSRTDPTHTKRVNQRGGFTAIDAHYQVQQATQAFGPVGTGWGYEVRHGTIEAGSILFASADVIVWHENRDQAYGPIRGLSAIVNQKGRVDEDAPKKALTDALTKALSHLGFSADVFLGKFDDNRYVQQVANEIAQESIPPRVKEIVADIKNLSSIAAVNTYKSLVGEEVKKFMAENKAAAALIKAAIRVQMKSLEEKEK